MLEADLDHTRRAIAFWAVFTLGGLLSVVAVATIVRNWFSQPLEHLVVAMTQLAKDDVDTPIPRLRRNDEIGAMNTALGVFKANLIHPVRLERNRKSLLDRLKET